MTNTALIIGAGDAGCGEDVEYWPGISGSACQPVENLPFPMFGHSAAAIGNLVYVCGGDDIPDYLHDCHVVDVTVGGAWQPAPPMRQGKGLFSLVSMGEYLLSLGGKNETYLDTIEIFDGESWQVMEFSLSAARYAHCSVRISQEEVLVLGGGGYEGRLTSVEVVNIVDGTHEVFDSMTMSRMYFGCSFSQEENRVYVSGGWGTTTLVEYLDLDTWQWTRIANLRNGRDGHQMGIIGGKLTVFGGAGHDYEYMIAWSSMMLIWMFGRRWSQCILQGIPWRWLGLAAD